jgi:two-component system, NarL family, nitrate/nitrite response regulator NarL
MPPGGHRPGSVRREEDPRMVTRLLILGEVGLYGEALARSLGRDERFEVTAIAASVEEALTALEAVTADVVLVDTRMPEATDAVRALAAAAPQVKLVALCVLEVEREVIAFAEAGASGYVALDGSMEDLAAVVESVERGEVLCSPGMAATLFRRVATLARERRLEPIEEKLTARELDVLRLIEEGLANKEIAAALSIELPTVKNHVHRILEKLNVRRRAEAAARARRLGLARLGGVANGQRN